MLEKLKKIELCITVSDVDAIITRALLNRMKAKILNASINNGYATFVVSVRTWNMKNLILELFQTIVDDCKGMLSMQVL